MMDDSRGSVVFLDEAEVKAYERAVECERDVQGVAFAITLWREARDYWRIREKAKLLALLKSTAGDLRERAADLSELAAILEVEL